MVGFNIIKRYYLFLTGLLRSSNVHLRRLIKCWPGNLFRKAVIYLMALVFIVVQKGSSDNEDDSFVPDGAGDTSTTVSSPRVRKGKILRKTHLKLLKENQWGVVKNMRAFIAVIPTSFAVSIWLMDLWVLVKKLTLLCNDIHYKFTLLELQLFLMRKLLFYVYCCPFDCVTYNS